MSEQDISVLMAHTLVIIGMGIVGVIWSIFADDRFEWFIAFLLLIAAAVLVIGLL